MVICMKILIGTTNPSKVKRFQELLSDYDVMFCTLADLEIHSEPEETGKTPEENAIIKAKYYGQYFDAVICNYSGLYIDTLPLDDEKQPGLHIRTPYGVRLDDEEMIAYYTKLVHSLGGRVLAYYLDGIAVYRKGKVFSFMENSEATKASAFYLVDTPSSKRHPGWPLDSISINRNTNTYFVETGNHKYDAKSEQILIGEYRNRLVQFLEQALDLEKEKVKNEDYRGRKATLADIPSIMRIISDAQTLLAADGIDQWQDGFPSEQTIREDVTERTAYVIESEGKIAAFVCVSLQPEISYAKPRKGQFHLDGSYVTIHRTAVSKEYRGRGLSKLLFQIGEKTAKQAGINNIRIDTHKDNKRMRHIVAREGFTECAVILLESGAERIAYEKHIS